LRYLITGGSGFVGERLVEELAARKSTSTILIADVKPPRTRPEKTGFRKLDVRSRETISELLVEEKPDVLVHLAFIVDPTHDEPGMYEVNVNGTFNVLAAAASAGTERVLAVTATMAYGAWPDNPVPITESQPVHGHAHYAYARHSTEADRIAQLWATLHRQRKMTIVRPCTIFGPGADNHLVRMWESQPFFPDFGNVDQPTQFLHVDDAASGLVALLEAGHPGVFNLVPDGEVTWRDCARIAGIEIRGMREESFMGMAEGMWRLRMPNVEIPPSFIDFFKYPYVASNDKIKDALSGWTPKHSSADTFEAMIASRSRAAAFD
jgi:UDP-glucose 4-epimerase